MRETWNKLNVQQNLSTAFHPQTDGETECVNQEIEQFLCVFCNYQQDNWANLLSFAEFAHNVRAHSTTRCSPFQVWYRYQPEFLPPINFASHVPTVKEHLKSLDLIWSKVSAALKAATEVMKHKGPDAPSQVFAPN